MEGILPKYNPNNAERVLHQRGLPPNATSSEPLEGGGGVRLIHLRTPAPVAEEELPSSPLVSETVAMEVEVEDFGSTDSEVYYGDRPYFIG